MKSLPQFDLQGISKNRAVVAAAAGLGAAALVFAVLAKVQVSSVADSLDVSHSVAVSASGVYDEDTYVTPTDDVYDDEGNVVGTVERTRDLNIIISDGSLKLIDSTVHLPHTVSSTQTDDIYVYLEGESSVTYDSSDGYIVVNENVIIKTIDAADATYTGVADFVTNDGVPILIGERIVTEDTAVAVLYTLADETSEITDEDTQYVSDILESATAGTPIENLTLFGQEANPDWAEEIIMTTRAVELIKGSLSVYISPYTGSFADGTTNTLTIGSFALTYCESALDTTTGLLPYIYEFEASQNGQISAEEDTYLKAKILAISNGTVKNLFQTSATVE